MHLNSFVGTPGGGRRVDYSTVGSEGYTIPDVVLDGPGKRHGTSSMSKIPFKIIAVGCGRSTVESAYYLQKHIQNYELVAYDKNPDIGGTWLENKYPGVACDIPSHAYAYAFAPNPDWPKMLASGQDVWAYLDRVCNVFRLRECMRFNTEVLGLYWQDDEGKWLVKLRKTTPGGQTIESEDTCDIVLYHKGGLNTPKMPKLPGLDKFRGQVIHTARWPKDYSQERWGERIAVLGSGASAIQAVPALICIPTLNEDFAQNHVYTQEERDAFRSDPEKLIAHGKEMDGAFNRIIPALFAGSPASVALQEMFTKRMAQHIKDERLLKGFTPSFAVGCRRVTPGDPYMKAIQEPNVTVHFTPVVSCTEDGVIGGDGVETKVDTIICATGFDVSYRPPFPVVGKHGIDLRKKWAEEANGPVINGTACGSFQANSMYGIRVIEKMQRDNIKSWMPRQDVTDKFNQHVQEWYKHTVWSGKAGECRTWYKNPETGRINAIWPGSAMHYISAIASPRWEDMEIEYHDENQWAHLGMGFTVQDRDMANLKDVSPHINVESIDKKWLDVMQTPQSNGSNGSNGVH
ncbi:hypothetical protein LTS12_019108 [Elasticomyces elasticus]|nr:hypothetical protein LTS12_019108 [Elasticomyces elasticus]